jgi:NADH-quinone oxidoreductase E subunit
MSFTFTPENQKKFDDTLKRYPNKKAALLPALWLAQKQNGHLSLDAQKYVASLLDLSPAHVYGVVSFYTMFHAKPVGKYHLQVCRTLSCALRGSENIIKHLDDKLGLKNGDITKDGLFSLEEVECLASCGTAPAMMVNEAYFENLSPERVDTVLEELKKRA